MQFRCPDCGREYNGSDKMIGGRARCADCRGVFVVEPARESPRRELPSPPATDEVTELATSDESEPRKRNWRQPADSDPDERQRILRRYLALSIWSIRFIAVLGIVSGVVGLFMAHSALANTKSMLDGIGVPEAQLGELRDLQRELGIENLPMGGLGDLGGSLGSMLKPNPWLYYGFPVLIILGSILIYLWGMAVAHFIALVIDLDRNTRTALGELRRSQDVAESAR